MTYRWHGYLRRLDAPTVVLNRLSVNPEHVPSHKRDSRRVDLARGISYDPNDGENYTGLPLDQSRTRRPRKHASHAGIYDDSSALDRLRWNSRGINCSY
jgi:hypothetical protein